MTDILRLFKNGVPTKNRVYNELNLSGKKSKSSYNLLIEIKNIILSITEDNILTKGEINNLFMFLMTNLKYKKFADAKKIINVLSSVEGIIFMRINSMTSHENKLYECYKHVLYNIKIFKCTISDNFYDNVREFEKIICFENLVNEILRNKDIKKSIYLIGENIDGINYHDHNNKGIDDILLEKLSISTSYNDLLYFKQLIKHIMNISSIQVDRKKLKSLFPEKLETDSYIDRKLKTLEYCASLDRYIIKKDFIVSIDNQDTIKVDDALSIDKVNDNTYLLAIHIADVYSLGYNDKIVSGGLSYKIPVKRNEASLLEKNDRNTITLFVEVDTNGIIKDHRLVKTRIEVSRNIYYDDVSMILNDDKTYYNKLKETIKLLSELCDILENKNDRKVESVNKIGHAIVNKFMILYGCLIAEYFYKSQIPCIYLNNTGNNLQYTMDNPMFETYLKDYHKYARATSPIYDRLSIITQFLIHIGYFSQIDDNMKKSIKLQLEVETRKLNNKNKKNDN